jgi:penicillin-insensitive murein endopeptidase
LNSFRKRLVVLLLSVQSLCVNAESAESSTCYGTTSKGRLELGVKLPSSGSNFESYSHVASLAGRTYVHSTVRTILLNAYDSLNSSHPKKRYKYAETGFEEGGKFKPHKTHQNGLSVDFMTPVIDQNGDSAVLSTHALNRYGYDIEFDAKGRYEDYTIDYDALAAHIVALDKAAKKEGVGLWRVIFAPELQVGLYSTPDGEYIRKHIQLSKKRSWVRHDEHYHVDFNIPCERLK